MSRLRVSSRIVKQEIEVKKPYRNLLRQGWHNVGSVVLLLALTFVSIGLLASCGDNSSTPSVFIPGTPTAFTVTAALLTGAGPVAPGTQVSLTGIGSSSAATPITTTVGANGAVTFSNVPAGTYVIAIPGVGNSTPVTISPNTNIPANFIINPNNPSPGQYCPSTTPGTGDQPPGAPACLPSS